METRLQQGEGAGTRSQLILSSEHNGFIEFELTSRQFEKIKLALPKPFYMIDPHNGGLEKMKKKLMEKFRESENSINEEHIWVSDIKEKIDNPFAKEKESSENKKKKKEDHTSKIKERDKNNHGKKRSLMKNKAIVKKKEAEINSISEEVNVNYSEFEGSEAERLKKLDKKNQQDHIEEEQIFKQNEELPPKSEPSFKENEQFFEHLNHQNFENHILKTELEVLDGGEHFFQYRPIRSLSSGEPRFIFRQELEHEEIENSSNTLRYQFGLPFYSYKGDCEQKLNQKQKNFCNNILHKLKTHRSSQGFRVPVDPDVQGVPDYFNVIYEPMDLQTITKKVSKDKYRYISEFHADISKILLNSYKYNPRETVYFEAAIDFEDYYHYLLRDAEQRSQEYATENLAKHPKLKKGDDFGELEFTEQSAIKKTRRDSKTRIKKSKSIIDFDEYHPEYQMFGQLKNYSVGYDDEYVVGNKKGKDEQFFEIENVKGGEEIRIFGKQNQQIANEEQKEFYFKTENKGHQYNYPPQYNIDRPMGLYMHSNHINHTQEGQFEGMKYGPAELESEGKQEYLESHYMMYPHYYNPHHPPINEYLEKMRNQNIYQNREAFHNRQIVKKKKSDKSSLRNDDYNDDDDEFIPEEKENFDLEKRQIFESEIKSMAGYNIEKEAVNYYEEHAKSNLEETLKRQSEVIQLHTEREAKENINSDENNSKIEEKLIKVVEMLPKSKEETKKPKKPKSQSDKTNVKTALNTKGNQNQTAIDNGHPEAQESIVVHNINSTFNFGQSNFEAIIEPPSTGPSITSKSKQFSKITKTKKKLEEEDEEYVESRYSKKNKERSRRRNHAAENSSKPPKKRGRHPKYKGKSSSIVGEDEEMRNDMAISQKQSDYIGSDLESEENFEGSQNFESFEQINNINEENGKIIPGEKRFNHEEIFMGESEIFEEDEGINVEEII